MRIVHLTWRITSLWSACMCRREPVRIQWRASSRKNFKIAKVYKRVKSWPVERVRKKLEMAKDSRVEASSRRSENPAAFILNWSCFKWITFMTSADSYRCDSYCLARVFQNLPAPPKHYGVFDVFTDFQSFFLTWKLGVALSNVHRRQISTGRRTNSPKTLPSATHAYASGVERGGVFNWPVIN